MTNQKFTQKEFRIVKEIIGKRIRKIRESKDYSQENVAGELNLTTSAYSKIERGETDSSASKLIKLAEILEVDVADFFVDVKKKTSKAEDPKAPYGFATKGDIEEMMRVIQEMLNDINQLKSSINTQSKPDANKRKSKK